MELITEVSLYPTNYDERDEQQKMNIHSFVVRVQWRGDGKYRVLNGASELSRADNWAFYPPKFKWHQYRFGSLEEALEHARSWPDRVKVNGRTWDEWQEFWKQTPA